MGKVFIRIVFTTFYDRKIWQKIIYLFHKGKSLFFWIMLIIFLLFFVIRLIYLDFILFFLNRVSLIIILRKNTVKYSVFIQILTSI